MHTKVTILTKITSIKDHLDQMLFQPNFDSTLGQIGTTQA